MCPQQSSLVLFESTRTALRDAHRRYVAAGYRLPSSAPVPPAAGAAQPSHRDPAALHRLPGRLHLLQDQACPRPAGVVRPSSPGGARRCRGRRPAGAEGGRTAACQQGWGCTCGCVAVRSRAEPHPGIKQAVVSNKAGACSRNLGTRCASAPLPAQPAGMPPHLAGARDLAEQRGHGGVWARHRHLAAPAAARSGGCAATGCASGAGNCRQLTGFACAFPGGCVLPCARAATLTVAACSTRSLLRPPHNAPRPPRRRRPLHAARGHDQPALHPGAPGRGGRGPARPPGLLLPACAGERGRSWAGACTTAARDGKSRAVLYTSVLAVPLRLLRMRARPACSPHVRSGPLPPRRTRPRWLPAHPARGPCRSSLAATPCWAA